MLINSTCLAEVLQQLKLVDGDVHKKAFPGEDSLVSELEQKINVIIECLEKLIESKCGFAVCYN